MSTGRRMDKDDVVHMYNGVLLTQKKEKMVPFAEKWMDLETVIQSEARKRKTNILTHVCGNGCTYLKVRDRDTDIEKKCADPKGRRGTGRLGLTCKHSV